MEKCHSNDNGTRGLRFAWSLLEEAYGEEEDKIFEEAESKCHAFRQAHGIPWHEHRHSYSATKSLRIGHQG